MINKIAFTSHTQTPQTPTKEPQPKNKENKVVEQKMQQLDENDAYKDPLKNWKLRCLSYSNEIGATINVIAPKLGLALWIPTFMYLGADIYDKYKNDKTDYDPSRKRGLEAAISQSVSSLLLPAVPILVGQKMTSPIGKIFSDRLSINEKDATIQHIHDFLDHAVGETFENKELYKERLKTALDNRIEAIKHDIKSDNLLKKVYKYFNGNYSLATTNRTKLDNFINQNSDELFEIKTALSENRKHPKISDKIFEQYLSDKEMVHKLYGEDKGSQAIRSALKKYENSIIFKNKIIKTVGGIVALILLIKPIDNFTQKLVIEKVVDPGIDLINNKIIETNLLRLKAMSGKSPSVELPAEESEIATETVTTDELEKEKPTEQIDLTA